MRTTLDIDDRLMAALMQRFPEKTKTQAIEAAVGEFLAHDAYEGVIDLAGRIDLDFDAIARSRAVDETRDRKLGLQ